MLGKLTKLISWQFHKLTRKPYYDSYAQCGEDMIARYFLPEEKGMYVDIGAFHPIHFSNTNHFYKKGWKGINIDASKKAIDLFNKHRPNDINLHYCVGSEEGKEIDFYLFKQAELNTCSKVQLDEILEFHNQVPIHKLSMKIFALGNILKQHVNENESIDLMTIDVEGVDEDVLQSNDWTKFKPKVIVIENHLSIEDFMQSACYLFLKSQQYVLGGFSQFSFVFYKKGLI